MLDKLSVAFLIRLSIVGNTYEWLEQKFLHQMFFFFVFF